MGVSPTQKGAICVNWYINSEEEDTDSDIKVELYVSAMVVYEKIININ